VLHPKAGRLSFEPANFVMMNDPDVRCCVFVAAGPESERKLADLLGSGGSPNHP
jgi:hypothetical protein